EHLLTLGFPSAPTLGEEPTLTSGILSAVRKFGSVTYIQTDTTFNHGNSGGPLFTPCGTVVGSVVFGLNNATALNFALSGSEIQKFLASPPPTATPPPTAVPTQTPTRTPGPAPTPTHTPGKGMPNDGLPLGSVARVARTGSCLNVRATPGQLGEVLECLP